MGGKKSNGNKGSHAGPSNGLGLMQLAILVCDTSNKLRMNELAIDMNARVCGQNTIVICRAYALPYERLIEDIDSITNGDWQSKVLVPHMRRAVALFSAIIDKETADAAGDAAKIAEIEKKQHGFPTEMTLAKHIDMLTKGLLEAEKLQNETLDLVQTLARYQEMLNSHPDMSQMNKEMREKLDLTRELLRKETSFRTNGPAPVPAPAPAPAAAPAPEPEAAPSPAPALGVESAPEIVV